MLQYRLFPIEIRRPKIFHHTRRPREWEVVDHGCFDWGVSLRMDLASRGSTAKGSRQHGPSSTRESPVWSRDRREMSHQDRTLTIWSSWLTNSDRTSLRVDLDEVYQDNNYCFAPVPLPWSLVYRHFPLIRCSVVETEHVPASSTQITLTGDVKFVREDDKLSLRRLGITKLRSVAAARYSNPHRGSIHIHRPTRFTGSTTYLFNQVTFIN